MSEHRWSRLRCSPLRLTTAAVFGSIDCALQFHSASSTTPPRRFGCRSVPPRHLRSVTARGAPLHLRLQTIFTPPFPLYPRHLRLCLRCRVRSHSSVPRNLRLLFRPVRTGICAPSSNRHTAAIRHHPPTHYRTDERTVIKPVALAHFSPCRAVWIYRRGQVCRRLPLSAPPGTWLSLWHFTAQYVSRSHPQSSLTPSIFGRGSASLHFG